MDVIDALIERGSAGEPRAGAGRASASLPARWSFADALRRNAAEQPDGLVYEFRHIEDGQDERLSHAQLAAWVGRHAAALRALPGGRDGSLRLVIALPQGRQFVVAFLACLAAGVVAVPTFPPRSPLQAERLRLVLREIRHAHVLAQRTTLDTELAELRRDPALQHTQWLDVEDLDAAPPASLGHLHPDPHALAMLQYTSGSTGKPKGVMLTQHNLVENSQLIQDCFGHRKADSRSVIWLPPYHDMGLVGGVLQPVHAGFASLLMPTSVLVRSPYRWLQAVSDFGEGCSGGVSSGGPNFAFQLCVQNIRDRDLGTLDLSRWRVAFCGAEPISARTLDAFAARFASAGFRSDALFPCYGMAETTLMVSGKPLGRALQRRHLDARSLARGQYQSVPDGQPDAQVVVSCGRPHPSLDLRIVDPVSHGHRGERELGEVWVRGGSVTQGYWQDPVRTAEVFGHSLDGEGGWLRTGDMGFVDGGEVFIAGRIKEVLIVRGANFYPQDLEHEALLACPELGHCRAAAFQIGEPGQERVVMVVEVPRAVTDYESIRARVNGRLVEKYGLRADTFLFVPRRTVRTTSSGKLQRLALRADLESGALPLYRRLDGEAPEDAPVTAAAPLCLDSEDDVCAWLMKRIATATHSDPARLSAEDSFSALAVDSVTAMDLLNEFDRVHGLQLSPDTLYRHNSPARLAREICRIAQRARTSP